MLWETKAISIDWQMKKATRAKQGLERPSIPLQEEHAYEISGMQGEPTDEQSDPMEIDQLSQEMK